jgi:hypothetical protein
MMRRPQGRARIARMSGDTTQHAPARAGMVLLALILVAGVANLNLSVANRQRPSTTSAGCSPSRSSWR